MNRFFSIVGFFLLLSIPCWAGGNKDKKTESQTKTEQQTVQQPASLYWTGDGGKGMSIAILTPKTTGLAQNQGYLPSLVQGEFVSNFSGYSAISVLDRERLDDQYAELLSGYYDDNTEAGLDLGHLTPTTYIMGGNITRTATGYALQMQITKTADKMTAASYSGTFTFSELDNLLGIRRASLDLLQKMGVTLTTKAQEELTGAATAIHVNAQTALAQGITAQKQGTEVAALSYYFQATTLDPSLLEAASRSSVMSANISSGNIGLDARNDIQWRKGWIDRLTECEAFFSRMINSGDVPYSLQYSTDIVTGTINYQTETANLIIQINLHSNEAWFSSLQKAVQAVYTGLNTTGRKNDWGLVNWPQQGVSNTNPFALAKQYDFSIVFELLNEENKVIGKQILSLKPIFQLYRPRDNNSQIMIDYLDDFYRTLTFTAVKVNDISDSLTIRVASINNKAPQNTPIHIIALSNPMWSPQLFFNHLRIKNGVVQGFKSGFVEGFSDLQIKQYYDFIFPENAWGGQMSSILTRIDEWAFHSYQYPGEMTSVTIPNGIISIGTRAFSGNKISKITIGANVDVKVVALHETRYHELSYFREFYETNGRKAGTYTFNENTKRWSWSN
jgi:hypothetical protein